MLIALLLEAKQNNTLPNALNTLNKQGIKASSIVDIQTGDTLLHWLCQHASIEFLYANLHHLRPYFSLTNNLGQNCFTQAIVQHRQAIIHLLLHFDRDDIFTDDIYDYINYLTLMEPQSPLKLVPVDYGPVIRFIKKFEANKTERAQTDLIQSIHDSIGLTVPCDELDNTLFHHIANQGILSEIDFALRLIPGNVDLQNAAGQTALMQVVCQGKQSVTSVLISHGANPMVTDMKGVSIYEYTAIAPKPIFFVATNVVPLLPELRQKVYALKSSEDLQGFLIWLNTNHLSLASPISSSDSTVLHFLVSRCPLSIMEPLLNKIPPCRFGAVNIRGETPLDNLINLNLTVKTDILAQHGAPSTQYTTQADTARHSLTVYLEANRLLSQSSMTINVIDIWQQFNLLGVKLDEPIDEWDNTALHILVKNLPSAILKGMLDCISKCNFFVTNYYGQTIMDIASNSSRLPLMQMLHEHYAFRIPSTHIKLYENYIKIPRFPSLYEYFVGTFRKENVAEFDESDKVEYFFTVFLCYIRNQGLRYNGVYRDGNYLLDCEYGEKYTVNCYDLASAFGYALLAIGISNVQIHHYTNVKSRPFNDKGPLQGDFVCFDREYHQNNYSDDDCFEFDDHYVLKVGSRFFDPTFCCYYDNENDLLPIPERIAVSIDYAVDQHISVNRHLSLRFIAGMNSLFNNTEWKYELNGENVFISKGSFNVELIQRSKHIHFSSQGLTAEQLSQVISVWYKNVPPIKLLKAAIYSSKDQNKLALLQDLKKLSEWSMPLKKRILN
jgi:ankyrin repeat protein